METSCTTAAPASANADVLAVVLGDDGSLPAAAADLDQALGGSLTRAIERDQVSGKRASSVAVTGGADGPVHVLLVGVGEKPADATERLRIAGGSIAGKARGLKAETVALLADDARSAADWGAVVEGIGLGEYRYEPYKTAGNDDDDDEPTPEILAKLDVITDSAEVADAVASAMILADATNWGRDLANTPGNDMTPVMLAAEAKALADAHDDLSFRVVGETEMQKLGMDLIYNVGRGSVNESQLIILEWNPSGVDTPDEDRIAFVGKAVTFDTGGISIKPSAGMPAMRLDKSGGCSVLGGMRAVAELGLQQRVLALVPAAENMPGGDAYKPGDVFTAYDGTTVEITNTDAEGRLVLADAITYARELGCAKIVELSTLTGMTAFFFGDEYAGLIARDGEWTDAVIAACKTAGDRAWPLPMDDVYKAALKSDIADMVNSGPRMGGALYAGIFLQHFARDTPFVHLDIAGSGMLDKPNRYFTTKGGSGWGVRMLAELARPA